MIRVGAIAVLALSLVLGVAQAAPVESFVEAPGPKGALKGTLLAPDGGAAPVVLLIPGSGNVDRDENEGTAIQSATLKLLAVGLGDQGIASVRIDKRGLYASAAAGDANSASIEDMGQDVHAWARVLTAKLGVRCVWVAGHSEGGAVAIAAARDPSQICGLVLISTAGRRLSDTIRDQISRSPGAGPLIPASDAILGKLEHGEHVAAADIPPPLLRVFHPAVQDLLIADFRFDPVANLRTYNGPVLIVQGQTDLQVSEDDARRLAAARPDATLMLVPGANHMLKTAPTDRIANLATYSDPSLPLAPGVVDAIAAFVKAHSDR